MLRRLGVFTAPPTETGAPAGTRVPLTCPMDASWATESEASPEGSEAAMPMSSVVGRTPMLWKLLQPPLPVKRFIPSCSRVLRAVRLPSMNWSKRELSETRVDSYIWIATPQNMEKLYSICEYSSVFCGVPVNRMLLFASTNTLELHHLGWKAALIMEI